MKLVLALTRLNPTLPGSFPFTGRGRLIILTALLAISWTAATALVQAQGPTMHPTFPLLDASGTNVLESRAPLSTLKTCGGCHDTAYIARHNFHADAGLSQFTAPGQVAGGRPWDTSPGYFGRWDPITYRYLTTTPTERLDLSLSDWIRQFGGRHVGGGPAELAASGVHRASPDSSQPVSPRINLETAEPDPWDWAESGGVELNCFLCHLPKPNNQARRQALAAGAFKWANTATLVGTGIVTQTNGEFNWLPQAFTPQGRLAQEFVTLQDPANDNCGLCHGQVHTNNDEPLILTDNNWRTATTGEIFSPQRVFKTGLNVQDKQNLSRALDVHAERVVDCVDCHNSVNNPVYFQGTKDGELAHLIFDARRISIEDYLYRPSHDLANGPSANRAMAPEFAGTPGRCQSCHDPGVVHEWLPYKEAHFAKLSCETCHVPKLYGPTYQQVDWTVVTEQGERQTAYRGVEGDPFEVETLLTGYQPILLPAPQNEGSESLAPYNLISAWYWVYGDPARPVRLVDLQAAYLDEAGYRPDVLAVFDANGNGTLEAAEQRLDTAEKETLIRQNLTSLGLDRLQIRAEIQPYSLSHNVVNGGWATKDCTICHSQDSLLAAAMPLAGYAPGGVVPELFGPEAATRPGAVVATDTGGLAFQPDPAAAGLYIFGYSRVLWIDGLGALAFLGTAIGVFAHAGLRVYAARRTARPTDSHTQRLYMYTVYERLWHWVQAAVILLLILTGLIIHKPDLFGFFAFAYVVQVHNVLGFVLLANAFLAVFYHLASGEIKQFIPQPRGFFDQMITQIVFYTRGIFRGDGHPFEKTPQKKLNPLQQITYFGLLNVLLPLQVITGVIIWGMQTWPQIGQSLGGLPVLAPLHSLIAWLFGAFIIMHMYLTTTGHTPLGGIQAMIDGWDELDAPNGSEAQRSEALDPGVNGRSKIMEKA